MWEYSLRAPPPHKKEGEEEEKRATHDARIAFWLCRAWNFQECVGEGCVVWSVFEEADVEEE